MHEIIPILLDNFDGDLVTLAHEQFRAVQAVGEFVAWSSSPAAAANTVSATMERPLTVERRFFAGDRLLGFLLPGCPEDNCYFGGSFDRVVVQVSSGLPCGSSTAPLGEHVHGDTADAPKPCE
ncbi:hypothetical protein D3C80_1403580 [compost metagenome]